MCWTSPFFLPISFKMFWLSNRKVEEEVRLPFFPIPKWTPPEKDSRVGHPWCSRGKRAVAFLVQKKIQGWRLSVPDGQTLIMAHPPSFSWPTMSCFLCAGNNSWPLQSIASMQHFQLLRWWKMVAVYLNLCCIFLIVILRSNWLVSQAAWSSTNQFFMIPLIKINITINDHII